jgi:hypothetical protein
MKRTGAAVAIGLVVVSLFAALAAISGRLSPMARRPLLDGGGPLVPYRWVTPPPEALGGNQPPSSGAFQLPLTNGVSEPKTFFTSDDQTTLIFSKGAIHQDGADSVEVDVTPLDPATLSVLPNGLSPFGNAVRVQIGDSTSFDASVRAVVLYPETPLLHALSHELLWSADGQTWQPLKTAESLVQQQVQANVPGPGYLLVGGARKEIASPAAVSNGRSGTISTVLLVLSGVSFLLGIGFLLRARQASRT